MRKREEIDILAYDPFAEDDGVGMRAYSKKVVVTRKAHKCLFNLKPHDIESGTRCVVHRALIDDRWKSFYLCASCIEAWEREGA